MPPPATPRVIGRVTELWRYPVKSTVGERLDAVRVGARGVEGDRRWAVRGADGRLGSGKTTNRRFRRMPGLLSLASSLDRTGCGLLRLPGGSVLRLDDPATARAVAAVVGEPVSLVDDPEGDHLDAAPVHLLSTASLAWLAGRRPADGVDRRRFRPNVLVEVDGGDRPEDDWVGRQVLVGSAVLSVDQRTRRCVMTTLAQGPLGFAPGVLRSLQDATGERLGVYASVVRPGTVRVGDTVALCDPAVGAPPPGDGPEGRGGPP